MARRTLLTLCIVALPLGAVGFPAWTGYEVWSASHHDEMHPADAIVVLGAAQYDGRPSPVLQARLEHAFYLWSQGMAPLIITTGGREPGDAYTEAGVGHDYLRSHGVPAARLLQEDQGRTTFTSLRNVRSVAAPLRVRTILLVSDPLHSARTKRMARDLGFSAAYASPASYVELNRSSDTKMQELAKETAALTLYEVGLDRG